MENEAGDEWGTPLRAGCRRGRRMRETGRMMMRMRGMMRLAMMIRMLTRPMNGMTGRIEHLSFQV